ncbi:MAG TPA: bifunctional hydroxymethylpyrimidine kinase/phosphomethylpyrimidine kinase [Kofleriaceae bacterium]|nr:bifunctional hydroxymethylpyrimidine kinase/phosphomethylpyrimidine kinase [Kofleriaceae bacterium]
MPYREAPDIPPNVLIVSGLDPSGGAGFIADVRVAERHHVRPVGVITALTEQNTAGVLGMHDMQGHIIESQLRLLLGDIEIRAGKIGMVGSARIAQVIGDALAMTNAPIVWDPVLAPSRGGGPLFEGNPFDAMAALASHITLLTPNTDEAHRLTGIAVTDEKSAIAAGKALVDKWVSAALIKGGHLGGDEAVDLLIAGGAVHRLVAPRVRGLDVHGTGCALSTSIAARLALGDDLLTACKTAKQLVAKWIAQPASPGRGSPAVL